VSSSNEGSTSDVRVEGLTKRYGSRNAVDRLDAEVPRSVIAAFVGPNRAGKSTMLRMPLGLVRRASGTGTVLGSSLDDPASYLHRVGGLVEGPAFYPALSGRRILRSLVPLGTTILPRFLHRCTSWTGVAGRRPIPGLPWG